MGPKSSLGWLLLIAVLAVPAVLFWNWWSKMQQTGSRFESARRPTSASAPFTASSAPAPGTSVGSSAAAPQLPPAPAAFQPPISPLGAQPAPSPSAMGRPKVEYAPSVSRDPTLSQIDLAMIAAEAAAKEHQRPVVRPRQPRIERVDGGLESKLELQGVVATPNGMMALVSGESLREGDQIYGFVVVRITTRFVTFKSGSRTFSKRVE